MPLPLIGAAIGGIAGLGLSAGQEIKELLDDDPDNNGVNWGRAAKQTAIGAVAGGTLGLGAAALGGTAAAGAAGSAVAAEGAAAGTAAAGTVAAETAAPSLLISAPAASSAAETAAVGTQMTLPGMEAAGSGAPSWGNAARNLSSQFKNFTTKYPAVSKAGKYAKDGYTLMTNAETRNAMKDMSTTNRMMWQNSEGFDPTFISPETSNPNYIS